MKQETLCCCWAAGPPMTREKKKTEDTIGNRISDAPEKIWDAPGWSSSAAGTFFFSDLYRYLFPNTCRPIPPSPLHFRQIIYVTTKNLVWKKVAVVCS